MSQTVKEMIFLKCGNCQRNLRVASSLLGRRIRCPKCKKPLQVPVLDTDSDAEDEYFPNWLKIFVAIPIVLLFFGIMSLAIGKIQAVLLFLVLGCLTVLIWKRDFVLSHIEQWQRESHQKALASQTTKPIRTSESKSSSSTKETAVDIDHLFELQTQDTAPSQVTIRPTVSSLPSKRSNIKMVSRWIRGASEDDVVFYGPNSVATVDGHQLDSPLIYFVTGTLKQPYDASLIETGLPVAKSGRGAYELPYWPNYRQCSPQQRRIYLNWLTSGRRDPSVELGYVFIYFYGLERRIVLDHKDSQAIISELLQLLPIYKYSRSFRSYCSSLLWMATLCAAESGQLSDNMLEQIINATEYWNEENISALLSIYQKQNLPVPPNVTLIITEHDSRSPRSVVFKRHPDKFRELFFARYTETFKDGFRLKTAKRDFNFDYCSASESLAGINGRFSPNRTMLPNTLGIPSQFKPLIHIWSEVIADLKAFDRIQRKSGPDQTMTAEMYEALPSELRNEDHPNFETWYQIIDQYTDDSCGITLVPVSKLATARGIPERAKLTKKQCGQILNSADCMDLCLEPDSRETGQNYRWNEFVSVFPRDYGDSENLASYHAASILLRLGISIAAADGNVDDEELRLITVHLEQQFELSHQESTRLEHLSLLLSRYPAEDTRLAKKLQELPEEQRNMVGDLLVGIASADDIVTPDESKALRKAFRNLNLDPARIDRLAEGKVSLDNDSPSDAELVLNHDRIREILSETSQVAEFLQNVMVEDEEEDEILFDQNNTTEVAADSVPLNVNQTSSLEEKTDVCTASESDIDCKGLDERYHLFLNELLTRPRWSTDELEPLARSQGLMLMGAIEAINEWALESLGDWIIDESDSTVEIAIDLINTNKTS